MSRVPGLLCFLLLSGAPAWAGKAEYEAELQRLREQLKSLAKRGLWQGVSDTYSRMEALKRVEPSVDDTVLAIQAAEALGDANLTWQRIRSVIDKPVPDEVIERYGRLSALYGEVDIAVKKEVTARVDLEVHDMPLDPAQRAAIEHCISGLKLDGRCQGLQRFMLRQRDG